MPKISEFFGISILMYWYDIQKHKMPHFHARYSGFEAVFDLNGTLIEGSLGLRADRLVKEWAEERHVILNDIWDLAVSGKELPWVLPLR